MMEEIWMNPPGVLYGISYTAAAVCYSLFVRRTKFSVRELLEKTALAFCLIGFMTATDGVPQLLFWPCMLMNLLLLYGMVHIGSGMDFYNGMYYTIHIFVMGEFCASLEWQLCYFVLGGKRFGEISPAKAVWLALLYIGIFALLYVIVYHLYRKQTEISVSRRQLVSVAVMAVVVFGMSNLSYLSFNTPFTAQLPREIFNIHTWVDLGGLAILFAYHTQLCEVQMKVDFDNMQNILDMQYANYQISKKSVDMVNQKYHDLKHQIVILKEEFQSREAMECLDKMQSEIESYEAQNKTGNKILDTILTGKSLYCQQNDIKLTCVADGRLVDFMDIMDISSLFGNALDNAIESVSAILEKEKKLIHLTISREKCFVRIRLENCYAGELDFENGLPKTTKQDRNYHGYGLKSIHSIVQKYGGSVTIDAKNGWFELRILMPLPITPHT